MKQTINIGTVANDGTGDLLRNAFDKVNDNFTELYNSRFIVIDINGALINTANVNTATGLTPVTALGLLFLETSYNMLVWSDGVNWYSSLAGNLVP